MNKKIIGKNIRMLRHIAQLSQTEFAAELGLTQQQISKYECGMDIPSTRVLRDMALKYDLPMDWFCHENGRG